MAAPTRLDPTGPRSGVSLAHGPRPDGAPLTGALADAVATLGPRAVLHDLYDPVGSRIYDDTVAQDSSEVRELSRLVRSTQGPILELAAGSGRLTMPLLRLRREVVALELSEEMIRLLGERAAGLPDSTRARLSVVAGDMGEFDLGRTVGVVVIGTSSISLVAPDRREQMFTCIRRHLAPGASVLVSVAEPVAQDGPATAQETVIVGRSGQAYRTYFSWEPAAGRRQVGVHPVDHGQDSIAVCVSRPALVRSASIIEEMGRAGLEVVGRHPVASGWPGFEEHFWEAVAR